MVIEIFNGNIAVPAKCGTRYFSKCVKSPERPVGYMERVVTDLPLQPEMKTPDGKPFPIENIHLWKEVKYFVVRDPYEHLKSALHTEIVNFWDDLDKVKSVVDEFISWGGNAHWHPQFYRKLYLFHKNYNIPRFKIIQINQITDFLLSLGYDIKYYKEEYSFLHVPNWKSKDDCVDIIKINFPNQWNEMLNYISNDMEYYNYIVNNKSKMI